jgi:CRISPR-associated DxTHG motif protein
MPPIDLTHGLRYMTTIHFYHLPLEDLKLLGSWIERPPFTTPVIVKAPNKIVILISHFNIEAQLDGLKRVGFSDRFQAIFRAVIADHGDVQLLMFDMEGPRIPGLSIFNWTLNEYLTAFSTPHSQYLASLSQ